MEPVVVKEPVVTTTEPTIEEPKDPVVPTPGSKTEPELLLKSLQEERDKRRDLEEELRIAREQLNERAPGEPVEDNETQERVQKLEDELAFRDTTDKYPILKEKRAEFEEFRTKYPAVEMESVAKLFLAENDLLTPTKRKGLEDASGGQRQPTPTGYTAEELETMRKTNFRKYSRLVKEGKVKIG